MNRFGLVPGMVVGAGGKYAIQLGKENGHYGWLFELLPSGWVSLRKAMDVEMEHAERQVRTDEFFNSFASLHPYR